MRGIASRPFEFCENLLSTSIISIWRGVVRQNLAIYFMNGMSGLRGIGGFRGLDKNFGEWGLGREIGAQRLPEATCADIS